MMFRIDAGKIALGVRFVGPLVQGSDAVVSGNTGTKIRRKASVVVGPRNGLKNPAIPNVNSRAAANIDKIEVDPNRVADLGFAALGVAVEMGIIGSHPRPVGFNDAVVQKVDSNKREGGSDSRNPIEAYARRKMPFPIAPLLGAMLFFCGGWLSQRGLVHGPVSTHVIGWLIMVVGGSLALIWAIPHAYLLVPR
jgi:hypothetical protein